MNPQRTLVQKILEVDYESLPPELIPIVKKSLIDTIGSIIIGSNEESIKILGKVFSNYKSLNGFTVFGKNYKLPLEQAVIINGTAAHAIDFDDTGAATQGHPSATIFPALLSLAEKYNVNGKKIIESYIVGVEVLSLLSKILPKLHLEGWHPSSVLGSIASTAACGKLIGLNTKQLINALSISASISGGLVANFGTMTKPLHIGKVGYNGVFATLLAENGFLASDNIFSTEYNYFKTLTGDVRMTSFNSILSTFGQPFAILEPGINFKLYPSCSLTHRSIDIIIDFVQNNNFSIHKIKKITCRVAPRTKRVLFFDNPSKPLEGKFSIPFIIACTLLYKKITPDLFNEEIINNPVIKKIMSKVDFNIHDDWVDGENDWRPDVIKIEFINGDVLSGHSVYPKGHSKNPVGVIEIKEKFYQCTTKRLSQEKMAKSYDLMNQLENLDNIYELLKCLTNN